MKEAKAFGEVVEVASSAEAVSYTHLDVYKRQPATMWDMVVGLIPGSIGETSVIAIALGAIILLWTPHPQNSSHRTRIYG